MTSVAEDRGGRSDKISWILIWAIAVSYLLQLPYRKGVGGVDFWFPGKEVPAPTLWAAALFSAVSYLLFYSSVEDMIASWIRGGGAHRGELQTRLARYEKARLGAGRFWLAGLGFGLVIWSYWMEWDPSSGGFLQAYSLVEAVTRSFWGASLGWFVGWSISGASILRAALAAMEHTIEPLHPDRCGGLEAFGSCLVRVNIPLLLTLLMLMSWIVLQIVGGQDPDFIKVTAVTLGVVLTIALYTVGPLWRAHGLLANAKSARLDRLFHEWQAAARHPHARKIFNEEILYVRKMSTWPVAWAAPLFVTLWAQVPAIVELVVKAIKVISELASK
jgi:hypothetical protein